MAVVCPFTQQPRVLPGHCSHPFLLRQMGHLAWPCPDLGLRREPHGRAKDLFTVCRRPLFHNCRAVSDPADHRRLLLTQREGCLPAAVLGCQPGGLNPLLLLAQDRLQPPGGPRYSSPSSIWGPDSWPGPK